MSVFPSSKRRPLVAVALYVCAWCAFATSQKEVCGPGPHVLNQTDLDVHLLPNSYVTLQPSNNQLGDTNSDIIWSREERNRDGKAGKKVKLGHRSHLEIGPMDKTLNLMALKYAYYRKSELNASFADHSRTAVLHLAIPSREVRSDRGFRVGQTVQVFAMSAQRISCFRIIPYNPVNVLLWKRDRRGILQLVSHNRYYWRGSCLWMNSLQRKDSGSYSLDIRSCFSQDTTHRINFRLFVIHRITFYSFSRMLNMSQQIDTGHHSRQIRSSSPLTLNLTKCICGKAEQRDGSWNVTVLFNKTMTIYFDVKKSTEVVVLFEDEQADRVRVKADKKGRFIRVKKVKHSDQGLYQVTAKKGTKVANVELRIIVLENLFPSTASYPTTTSAAHISVLNNVTATLSNSIYSLNSSRDTMEGKDGIQGWVIGIIIICILIVLAIPAIYYLYKHHQFLRSCSYLSSFQRSKNADSTNSNYTDAYVNAEMPTASSSQDRNYANTTFVSDVVNGVPAENSRELNTANTYDSVADIFPDRDTQTEQSQVAAQYAVVDKKMKKYNNSTSESLEETTLTQQSSDFPHSQQVAVEETRPGFEEEGNVQHVVRPKAAPRTFSGKKRNPSDIKRPTRDPPPPPVSAQHQPSQEHHFEGGKEPVSPFGQRQGKPQTDICFKPPSYTEIVVQTTYPEQQSSQNFKPYPGNQRIQYVDLDVTALSKRT